MKVIDVNESIFKDIGACVNLFASQETNYENIRQVMDRHGIELDTPQEMWDIYVEVKVLMGYKEENLLTIH